MSETTPDAISSFENELDAALRTDRITVPRSKLARFAREIEYSRRLRERGPKRLPTTKQDILHHIEESINARQMDEVVWRVFLAAHFGRLSAPTANGDAESAGLLLYGFGDAPQWTWVAISPDDAASFERWLREHPQVSRVLRFGNHRKHEDPNVDGLIEVVRSFIGLAGLFNGPANIIKAPGLNSPFERFDLLFRKIKIHRFNRLGNWDFIDLLAQLKLTDAEPEHCYLKDASGPLEGAQQIWGKKSVDALNDHTARLARSLRLSCFVLEDALCNFQKDGDSCCGEPDEDGVCLR